MRLPLLLTALLLLAGAPSAQAQDDNWIHCADEDGFCRFRGPGEVRYGAHGRFVSRMADNGIPCNNRVFGDPAVGRPKACYVREIRRHDWRPDREDWRREREREEWRREEWRRDHDGWPPR